MSTMQEARNLKYKKYSSIHDRYPGIPVGMQLLDAIKADFLVLWPWTSTFGPLRPPVHRWAGMLSLGPWAFVTFKFSFQPGLARPSEIFSIAALPPAERDLSNQEVPKSVPFDLFDRPLALVPSSAMHGWLVRGPWVGFAKVRSNVKASFYDEANRTKLIVPDRRNLRRNAVQIQRFKQSVLRFGNIQGVRGAAIAVLSPGGGPPWNMITYGSVSRAVYMAAEEAWDSPNVQATLRQGLMVDEYDPLLPDDVAEHLRDFFNRFHQGVTQTFAEASLVLNIHARADDWFSCLVESERSRCQHQPHFSMALSWNGSCLVCQLVSCSQCRLDSVSMLKFVSSV